MYCKKRTECLRADSSSFCEHICGTAERSEDRNAPPSNDACQHRSVVIARCAKHAPLSAFRSLQNRQPDQWIASIFVPYLRSGSFCEPRSLLRRLPGARICPESSRIHLIKNIFRLNTFNYAAANCAIVARWVLPRVRASRASFVRSGATECR